MKRKFIEISTFCYEKISFVNKVRRIPVTPLWVYIHGVRRVRAGDGYPRVQDRTLTALVGGQRSADYCARRPAGISPETNEKRWVPSFGRLLEM